MERKEFVGSVRISPIFHELARRCSAALAALSSGVLLFALQGSRPESLLVQVMLCLHAFSIPCLVAAFLFFAIFDAYERVSVRTEMLLDRMLYAGFAASMGGYFLLVSMFSRWLFLALLCGIVFSVWLMRAMTKELDAPHMKRRE